MKIKEFCFCLFVSMIAASSPNNTSSSAGSYEFSFRFDNSTNQTNLFVSSVNMTLGNLATVVYGNEKMWPVLYWPNIELFNGNRGPRIPLNNGQSLKVPPAEDCIAFMDTRCLQAIPYFYRVDESQSLAAPALDGGNMDTSDGDSDHDDNKTRMLARIPFFSWWAERSGKEMSAARLAKQEFALFTAGELAQTLYVIGSHFYEYHSKNDKAIFHAQVTITIMNDTPFTFTNFKASSPKARGVIMAPPIIGSQDSAYFLLYDPTADVKGTSGIVAWNIDPTTIVQLAWRDVDGDFASNPNVNIRSTTSSAWKPVVTDTDVDNVLTSVLPTKTKCVQANWDILLYSATICTRGGGAPAISVHISDRPDYNQSLISSSSNSLNVFTIASTLFPQFQLYASGLGSPADAFESTQTIGSVFHENQWIFIPQNNNNDTFAIISANTFWALTIRTDSNYDPRTLYYTQFLETSTSGIHQLWKVSKSSNRVSWYTICSSTLNLCLSMDSQRNYENARYYTSMPGLASNVVNYDFVLTPGRYSKQPKNAFPLPSKVNIYRFDHTDDKLVASNQLNGITNNAICQNPKGDPGTWNLIASNTTQGAIKLNPTFDWAATYNLQANPGSAATLVTGVNTNATDWFMLQTDKDGVPFKDPTAWRFVNVKYNCTLYLPEQRNWGYQAFCDSGFDKYHKFVINTVLDS